MLVMEAQQRLKTLHFRSSQVNFRPPLAAAALNLAGLLLAGHGLRVCHGRLQAASIESIDYIVRTVITARSNYCVTRTVLSPLR